MRLCHTAFFAFIASATSVQAQATSPSSSAPSAPFANKVVVRLLDGPNRVDINGDGKPDLVLLAWLDNGNAHGRDIVTFYLAYTQAPPIIRAWLVVPLYDSSSTNNAPDFRTSMGADCILRDIRVLRPKGQVKAPVQLVTAERDFGQTYVDSMPVTFTVYRFVADTPNFAGSPPYYFQAFRTIRSHGKYCDVNDAFRDELGLAQYRDFQ